MDVSPKHSEMDDEDCVDTPTCEKRPPARRGDSLDEVSSRRKASVKKQVAEKNLQSGSRAELHAQRELRRQTLLGKDMCQKLSQATPTSKPAGPTIHLETTAPAPCLAGLDPIAAEKVKDVHEVLVRTMREPHAMRSQTFRKLCLPCYVGDKVGKGQTKAEHRAAQEVHRYLMQQKEWYFGVAEGYD